MVAPTPTPSFDAYYCISQPSVSSKGSDNTVAIIILAAGVIVTAAIAYYSITENRKLKQMISDMKSKKIGNVWV